MHPESLKSHIKELDNYNKMTVHIVESIDLEVSNTTVLYAQYLD